MINGISPEFRLLFLIAHNEGVKRYKNGKFCDVHNLAYDKKGEFGLNFHFHLKPEPFSSDLERALDTLLSEQHLNINESDELTLTKTGYDLLEQKLGYEGALRPIVKQLYADDERFGEDVEIEIKREMIETPLRALQWWGEIRVKAFNISPLRVAMEIAGETEEMVKDAMREAIRSLAKTKRKMKEREFMKKVKKG